MGALEIGLSIAGLVLTWAVVAWRMFANYDGKCSSRTERLRDDIVKIREDVATLKGRQAERDSQ